MFNELKPYELEVNKLLEAFTFDELLEYLGLDPLEVLEILITLGHINIGDMPFIEAMQEDDEMESRDDC